MALKRITLHPGDYIVAVVPEVCSGPGWNNRLVSVIISNSGTNRIRAEYLQPDEQSAAMAILFDPAATMHRALVDAVPVTKEP